MEEEKGKTLQTNTHDVYNSRKEKLIPAICTMELQNFAIVTLTKTKIDNKMCVKFSSFHIHYLTEENAHQSGTALLTKIMICMCRACACMA